MRHATPCPTVLSEPDQRLNTTPTLPGWMIVKEAQAAAMTKRTMPRTIALASMAGVFPRNSSAIAPLRPERPVATPLEDDDARPARAPAPRHAARDARLQPAAERTEHPVEDDDEPHQEEELARPDHDAWL